jgi:hypothetical protein
MKVWRRASVTLMRAIATTTERSSASLNQRKQTKTTLTGRINDERS